MKRQPPMSGEAPAFTGARASSLDVTVTTVATTAARSWSP